MFYKHLIIDDDDTRKLYLFIDFNYEFSRDFKNKGKKAKIETLYEKVYKYIKDKKIDFDDGKVFLVVGGLIIGTLFLQGYQHSEVKDSLEPKYTYVEQVNIFSDNKNENIFVPPITENKDDKTDTVEEPNNDNIEKESTNNNVATTPTQKSTANTTTAKPPINQPSQPITTPVQEPVTTAPPIVETAPPAPVEKMVTIYRYNGIVEQISLENYVVGVVSGEMPASFNSEALKAQSILARTYALKKIAQGQVLKDSTDNQVYKDEGQLKALWGGSFDTYYNKVKSAVSSTKGQYLSYNNNYIEAVYHSTSNGKTEDSVAVWGNSYSYLKSVDSHWDLEASSYLRQTEKEFSVLSSIIGLDFSANTNIEILSRTSGDRIDKIKINDKVFTGVELRTLLGLRSADFDIVIENGKATFVTRGYGHGVGMSQYGANGMAKQGFSYSDILSHYYPGTQLKS